MNLKRKKQLAARTLKVGGDRIVFVPERMEEIKEAITKQDIKDLMASKAILIKEKKGRRKVLVEKKKRVPGKIKKKIRKRKKSYVKLTRKLREQVKKMKEKGKITKEEYEKLRKKIKIKAFRSKMHLKELTQKEKFK